ncbi:RNA recognition motif, partial [Trifolium medium]|nr:RNA recognition motif [Trifolium medium]
MERGNFQINQKKRRNEYLFWGKTDIPIDLILFQEANKPPDSWFELKVNTHVYVTGLPEDVTVDEVVETFSKYGIIKE